MSVKAAAIFDYEAQPKEELTACNLCGGSTFSWLAGEDRYGLPVTTQGCMGCGLVFLNPRMTKEAYAEFYRRGYRPLVSAFHGRVIDAQTIQPEQLMYAGELALLLEPYMSGMRTLLDIGGSTGVVARALSGQFSLKATVLDPAPDELKHAADLEVIPGFVEDLDTERKWDVVTMCQTADHVLDLSGTLRKVREMEPQLFFVDIVDFDVTREIKVDHPYNLTERTMGVYLDRAGLVVKRVSRAKDGIHVGFVCF